MRKKIIFLGILVVLLSVVALVLKVSLSHVPKNKNPFADLDKGDILEVEMKGADINVSLKQKSGQWFVSVPDFGEDWADKPTVDRLLATLVEFRIGSEVSSNPGNYEKYGIEETRADHLVAKAEKGQELNIWVGQGSPNFDSSYVRFNGQDPVYMADGFPSYVVRNQTVAYRQKLLLPIEFSDLKRISIDDGPNNLEILRSSDTWVIQEVNVSLTGEDVRDLSIGLGNLRAQEFADPIIDSTKPTMDHPGLKITLESDKESMSALITNRFVDFIPDSKGLRYAWTEGRDAVMYVGEDRIKELADVLDRLRDRVEKARAPSKAPATPPTSR